MMYSRDFSDKTGGEIVLPAHYGGTAFRDDGRPTALLPEEERSLEKAAVPGSDGPAGNAPEEPPGRTALPESLSQTTAQQEPPPGEDESGATRSAGILLAGSASAGSPERPEAESRATGILCDRRANDCRPVRKKEAFFGERLFSDPEEILLAALSLLLFRCENRDDLLACILLYLLFV